MRIAAVCIVFVSALFLASGPAGADGTTNKAAPSKKRPQGKASSIAALLNQIKATIAESQALQAQLKELLSSKPVRPPSDASDAQKDAYQKKIQDFEAMLAKLQASLEKVSAKLDALKKRLEDEKANESRKKAEERELEKGRQKVLAAKVASMDALKRVIRERQATKKQVSKKTKKKPVR